MVAAHPSVQGISCLSFILHATYLTLHQTHQVVCLTFKIGSGLVSSSCAVASEAVLAGDIVPQV